MKYRAKSVGNDCMVENACQPASDLEKIDHGNEHRSTRKDECQELEKEPLQYVQDQDQKP